MTLFSNRRRATQSGGKMPKQTIQRLCNCPPPRTREPSTPQQCRRCGFRINRCYDVEIAVGEPISLVIELPEEDWEYPAAEQD